MSVTANVFIGKLFPRAGDGEITTSRQMWPGWPEGETPYLLVHADGLTLFLDLDAARRLKGALEAGILGIEDTATVIP